MDAGDEGTRGILRPDAGAARFTLTRRLPDPALTAHVDRHWIVAWDLGDAPAFTQTVLPHPCVNLVSEPGLIAVWGIPLGQSPHTLQASGMAIGTKFRPGGFAPFTERALHTLSDQVEPLPALFGAAGRALAGELAAAAGDPDRHIAAAEAFFLARLPEADGRLALVRSVVDDIALSGPGLTVAGLASRHGISSRTLQRLFRDTVGVGPKWVLKRYRVLDAAERIAAGEVDDPAGLALELGYFDQAHFTRDFTDQIGQPPLAYARACAAAAGRRLAVTS